MLGAGGSPRACGPLSEEGAGGGLEQRTACPGTFQMTVGDRQAAEGRAEAGGFYWVAAAGWGAGVTRTRPQGRPGARGSAGVSHRGGGPGGHLQAAGPRLPTHSKSQPHALLPPGCEQQGEPAGPPSCPLRGGRKQEHRTITRGGKTGQGGRTLQPPVEVTGQDSPAVRPGAWACGCGHGG